MSRILKNHIQVQKEKENLAVACLRPPQNGEIRNVPVVVVQRGQRNVQKSGLHVHSCCFPYSTYCFFEVLVVVAVVAS